MKNYLLSISFLLSLQAGAQLSVGDGSLTLAAGTSLQLERNITLLPSEPLTITNNHFSQSTVPVSLNGAVSSIGQVISFRNPLDFTGRVCLFVDLSGLNGYNLEDLKLSFLTGGNWSPSINSVASTTGFYVDEVIASKTFAGVTASSMYVPLPVTLVSFTARRQEAQVLLQWQTAQETNNSHFTIEKSSDGRNFTTLGKVAASAATGAAYSFTDAHPFGGNNYYRLRQHDRDGSQRLHGVRLVQWNLAAGTATLFPNPVRGESLTIDLKTDVIRPLTYTISNAAGMLVRTGQVTNRQQVLSLGPLPAGIYLLQLGNGQTIRFQKQ